MLLSLDRESPELHIWLSRGDRCIVLQFTILTAARTGEVANAKWNEIDLIRLKRQ